MYRPKRWGLCWWLWNFGIYRCLGVRLMNTYAFVYLGRVQEIIKPMTDENGEEIPLYQRYTPQFCAECIDITNITPQPQYGWTYDGTAFSSPS